MILSSGGINWTWYTQGVLVQNQKTGVTSFRILAHWRLHNTDWIQGAGKHPNSDGSCNIVEDGNRTAVSIQISQSANSRFTTYPVENPKYVFDYPNQQQI